MIHKIEVLRYIKQTYGIDPDYPFSSAPEYAVTRHQSNQKWFSLVMEIDPHKLGLDRNGSVTVMNVKVEKDMAYYLRDNMTFFKAYHMNKENWISILLDSASSHEAVYRLIDESYHLTKD